VSIGNHGNGAVSSFTLQLCCFKPYYLAYELCDLNASFVDLFFSFH
jgi:hypothetical protein